MIDKASYNSILRCIVFYSMPFRFLIVFITIIYFLVSTRINYNLLLFMPIATPTLLPCWILACFSLLFSIFYTSNRTLYDNDIYKISLVFIVYYYFHEKGFENQRSIESIICKPLLIFFALLWEKMTNFIKINKFNFFGIFLASIGFIFPVFFLKNTSDINLEACFNYTCEFLILSLLIKFYKIKKKHRYFDIFEILFTLSFLIWILSSIFLVFQSIICNCKNFYFFKIEIMYFCIYNLLSIFLNLLLILELNPILIAFIQITSTSLSYAFYDFYFQKSSKWSTIFSSLIFLIGLILYYYEYLYDFFIRENDDNRMEYPVFEQTPDNLIINI